MKFKGKGNWTGATGKVLTVNFLENFKSRR